MYARLSNRETFQAWFATPNAKQLTTEKNKVHGRRHGWNVVSGDPFLPTTMRPDSSVQVATAGRS
jgi:hypothetical protein